MQPRWSSESDRRPVARTPLCWRSHAKELRACLLTDMQTLSPPPTFCVPPCLQVPLDSEAGFLLLLGSRLRLTCARPSCAPRSRAPPSGRVPSVLPWSLLLFGVSFAAPAAQRSRPPATAHCRRVPSQTGCISMWPRPALRLRPSSPSVSWMARVSGLPSVHAQLQTRLCTAFLTAAVRVERRESLPFSVFLCGLA